MDMLLFDLKPIGIGSLQTESLLSYISRIANVNSISLRDIITIIKKEYSYGSIKANRISLARYCNINGLGDFAKVFSDAISALSSNDDIRYLTMLTWMEVISARKLIRNSAAWCPYCYQEWSKQNKPIYIPLIWNIDAVEICIHHHIKLRKKCPHCKQSMDIFSANANPGYCANCNKWLGLDQWYEPVKHNDWDIWAYNNVDKLIAVAAYTDNPPKKEIISTNLKAIINSLVLRNQVSVARLSHLAGIPNNTMHEYYNGNSIPSLNALLKICKAVNVSLINFLTKDFLEIGFSPEMIDLNTKATKKQKKRTRPEDLDKIKKQLKEIYANIDARIPLSDVSGQIGVDEKTLRKYFPDLSKAITTKGKDEEREIKIRQLCTEVRDATLYLHSQGVYPSRRKVDELCSLKGINIYNEVKEVWENTKKELGY